MGVIRHLHPIACIRPSSVLANSFPSASASDSITGDPSDRLHASCPVSRFTAYTIPSVVAKYAIFPATTGDPRIAPFAWKVHNSSGVVGSMARNTPSESPT